MEMNLKMVSLKPYLGTCLKSIGIFEINELNKIDFTKIIRICIQQYSFSLLDNPIFECGQKSNKTAELGKFLNNVITYF